MANRPEEMAHRVEITADKRLTFEAKEVKA